MPYKIDHQGDEWLVLKEDDDRVMGHHPSEGEAEDQLKALYANEPSVSRGLNVIRFDMDVVRVDADRREVWGWASSSTLGLDNKVITHDCNKEAFEEWVTRGNIREMHQPIAAGRAIAYEADDANQRIYLGSRVSRGAESTWEKILDGTLSAYSVNAKATKHHVEIRDGRAVDIVERMRIREVSYVDSPGDPTANFVNIVRSVDEGSLEVPDTLVRDMDLEWLRRIDQETPAIDDGVITRDDTSVYNLNADDGVSAEEQDASLAQHIIDKIGLLIRLEAGEVTDPKDSNNGAHMQALLEARACMVRFQNAEEQEVGMTDEEMTRAAKAAEGTAEEEASESTEEEDKEKAEGEGDQEDKLERADGLAAITEILTGMHETLVRLQAKQDEQDEITRSAAASRASELDEIRATMSTLLAQEMPGNRPSTRVVPVEKAFGLEDGGQITRDGAAAGFDILRKSATSREDLQKIDSLQAVFELKQIYAEGPRPSFRS